MYFRPQAACLVDVDYLRLVCSGPLLAEEIVIVGLKKKIKREKETWVCKWSPISKEVYKELALGDKSIDTVKLREVNANGEVIREYEPQRGTEPFYEVVYANKNDIRMLISSD